MDIIELMAATQELADALAIPENWHKAYDEGTALLFASDCMEPRSILKQAAADNGIPYGAEMGSFIAYAEKRLFAD